MMSAGSLTQAEAGSAVVPVSGGEESEVQLEEVGVSTVSDEQVENSSARKCCVFGYCIIRTCQAIRHERDLVINGPPAEISRSTRRGNLFMRHCKIVMCMSEPVVGLLVSIVGYVWICGLTSQGSDPFVRNLPFFAGFGENRTSALPGGTGDLALGTFWNALFLLSTVIFATLLFLFFFRFRWRRASFLILVSFFVLTLSAAPAYLSYMVCARFHIPLDWITVAFFSYNLAVVGAVVIYWEFMHEALEKWEEYLWGEPGGTVPIAAHQWLVHVYLVLYSAGIAWPFMCMDEWTVWAFLLLLIVWDLLAVLTPCGPLRYIMLIEQQRKNEGAEEFKLPPGLIYETRLFTLGTGDLIFFGVVVGRAATINFVTTVCTFLAIFAGMSATIWVTIRSNRHALPALPLALGMAFFSMLTGRLLLDPYVQVTLGAGIII